MEGNIKQLFGSDRNYFLYLVLCGVLKSSQCAVYIPQYNLTSHYERIYDSPSNEFHTRLQGKTEHRAKVYGFHTATKLGSLLSDTSEVLSYRSAVFSQVYEKKS
jgi:hypothetical protein